MIPRVLHQIWFGGKPVSAMSDLNKKCLESIVDILPDYQYNLWDDSHGMKVPWVKRALEGGHICAACNYFRIWKLHEVGGVYVDTDVQMLRPFDLAPACFIGFQREDTEKDCINTAVMGCVPGNRFAKSLLAAYEGVDPSEGCISMGCTIPTALLFIAGMDGLNVTQRVGDIEVFAREYFHPRCWMDRSKNYATGKTVCIHHFEGSWLFYRSHI